MLTNRLKLMIAGAGLAIPLASGGGLSLPAMANAAEPAFDCSKAEGAVQELICADADLAGLDQTLNSVFAQAIRVLDRLDDKPGAAKAKQEMTVFQRGWIKGRDDCWKADNVKMCVTDEYRRRIAELQARWIAEPAGEAEFYACNGEPANVIVVTRYTTDPAAIRIERGDSQMIAILREDSNPKVFEGSFGNQFVDATPEVTVEWPQGEKSSCTRTQD